MTDKFQNKYRTTTTRLQSWDYRWTGAYFITICTQNRAHYFGEVKDGKMQLSSIGMIADIFWFELKNRTPNIELGEYIIMPDHIHGIIIINDVQPLHATAQPSAQPTTQPDTAQPDEPPIVQPLHATAQPTTQPTPQPKNEKMAQISPKANSISSIIRSYKSAVTKHAHRFGFEFQWQSLFYDHIIRDDRAFHNISEYIINNPQKWEEKYNK